MEGNNSSQFRQPTSNLDKNLIDQGCSELLQLNTVEGKPLTSQARFSSENELEEIALAHESININCIHQARWRDYQRNANLAYWLMVGCIIFGLVLIPSLALEKVPEALVITAVGLVFRYWQIARKLAKDTQEQLELLSTEVKKQSKN